MAKNKPEKPATPKPRAASPPGEWPLPFWLRLTASVALAWHLAAVFLPPLSLQPKSSQLAVVTAQSQFLRWYTDPLYLNGGYSFFSPDPPLGGRLIRYVVYGESGEPIVEGEFPNRRSTSYATQWPRLWYHRHMMLVDQSADLQFYPPDDMSPTGLQRASRRNHELALRCYARHLLRKHHGQRAELKLISHRSLEPEEVQAGLEPTDPSLYRTEFTVVESAEQLGEPLLPTQDETPPLLPMRTAG